MQTNMSTAPLQNEKEFGLYIGLHSEFWCEENLWKAIEYLETTDALPRWKTILKALYQASICPKNLNAELLETLENFDSNSGQVIRSEIFHRQAMINTIDGIRKLLCTKKQFASQQTYKQIGWQNYNKSGDTTWSIDSYTTQSIFEVFDYRPNIEDSPVISGMCIIFYGI